MKRFLSFCVGLIITSSVFCQLPLADPFVFFHGGKYYAYGTGENGFRPYVSDDMQIWSRSESLCLNPEDSYGSHGFWAPEVYYFKSTGKFHMYYTAEEHICVAISDSPLGPFVQQDRRPMREEKGIDPSIYFDESGKIFLYFVRFTDGNVIWSAELSPDGMSIKENTLKQCLKADASWELKLGKVTEGPSVIKHEGKYYLIYSANDFRSKDYAVGYATSDSPDGPWKKYEGNPVLHSSFLKNVNLSGTGHGAPFIDNKGHWHYIFHAHASDTKVSPRSSYVTAISFDAQGNLHIGDTVFFL